MRKKEHQVIKRERYLHSVAWNSIQYSYSGSHMEVSQQQQQKTKGKLLNNPAIPVLGTYLKNQSQHTT